MRKPTATGTPTKNDCSKYVRVSVSLTHTQYPDVNIHCNQLPTGQPAASGARDQIGALKTSHAILRVKQRSKCRAGWYQVNSIIEKAWLPLVPGGLVAELALDIVHCICLAQVRYD